MRLSAIWLWIAPAIAPALGSGRVLGDRGDVAEQERLEEQQPDAQPDERGDLIADQRAHADADRPRRARRRARRRPAAGRSRRRSSVDLDAARGEPGGLGAGGQRLGQQADGERRRARSRPIFAASTRAASAG